MQPESNDKAIKYFTKSKVGTVVRVMGYMDSHVSLYRTSESTPWAQSTHSLTVGLVVVVVEEGGGSLCCVAGFIYFFFLLLSFSPLLLFRSEVYFELSKVLQTAGRSAEALQACRKAMGPRLLPRLQPEVSALLKTLEQQA